MKWVLLLRHGASKSIFAYFANMHRTPGDDGKKQLLLKFALKIEIIAAASIDLQVKKKSAKRTMAAHTESGKKMAANTWMVWRA